MPNICVEGSSLSEGRFWKLCQDMGFTREQGIGTLMCLWHDSQERRIVQAPKEEILKLLTTDAEKLFTALHKHDYLTALLDGTFEIRGNRKRLIDAGAKPADLPAKVKKAAKPKQPSETAPLLEAYNEEYQKKYNHCAPPAGVVERSQFMTLVKNFGKEKAVELIKFYFRLSDTFYVSNFHSLAILVKQRHRIWSSMETGLNFNKAKILRMEKSQQFQQTLMDIESGVI